MRSAVDSAGVGVVPFVRGIWVVLSSRSGFQCCLGEEGIRKNRLETNAKSALLYFDCIQSQWTCEMNTVSLCCYGRMNKKCKKSVCVCVCTDVSLFFHFQVNLWI